MSHRDHPSSPPQKKQANNPDKAVEESAEPARESGSSGVSRRRFLALSAGLTTAITLPVLLEGCGEPVPGVGESGPDVAAGETTREVQSQEARREAREAGREAREAGRDAREVGREPQKEADTSEMEAGREPGQPDEVSPEVSDADAGGEVAPEHSTSEAETIPEIPGADAEVDLRNEPTPESQVVTFDITQYPEDRKLFSLGAAAGAMLPDSAMLWTFLDQPTQATVRVWQDGPRPGTVVMIHERSVNSNADGYLKLQLGSLQPGTWYQYAFFQGQKRSVVGRFRTAFAPGAMTPLMIGAATCTNNSFAPFESLRMMAQEPIDMFVHLGDMSYNDSAKDLSAYRKKWRDQIRAGGYKELLPRAGMYMTWDDHEVDNNWNPETFSSKRLQAAKQAFFETLPVERGPGDRLWRSYQWGNTAEILVLDCRSERKPSTRKSKSAVYLGAAQMTWLKDRLRNSTAHFKILMNSVPMTNMPALWVSSSDRWEGYEAQRKEVLDFITTEKIKHVWFLSGDFHVGFVGRVEKSGPLSKVWEVAVGPSDSFPNPLGLTLPKAQFPYHSSNTKVMTTLTFDPNSSEVRIRFVDANKSILFDQIITPQT